jgi:large subunit ribosomal protein L17
MAKKAHLTDDPIQKLHYRRLVISRIRDEDAAAILFNDRAAEFAQRSGGYSRIYKLVQRIGDAAKLAIIELISGDDVGYSKSRKRKNQRVSGKQTAKKAEILPVQIEQDSIAV